MSSVECDVAQWLTAAVVGLNLCPFSHKPLSENRVRFCVSLATREEELLTELADELRRLDECSSTQIETTLLIVPNMLQDFFDYTQFIVWANAFIKRQGWKGIYQLASFHPNYCFSGAESDDVENLTNRAPYPILHIIREASLANALIYVEDVESIPERNKQRMRNLSDAEKQTVFPYVFNGKPSC